MGDWSILPRFQESSALKLQIERRRGGKVPNSRSVINIGLQNPTPTEDGGIHKFFLDLAFIGGSNVPLFF